MKRRAFLGFLGGAAAAGPKLAQSLAATVSSGGSPPMGYVSGGIVTSGGMVTSASGEGDWRLARIEEIKGILSGKNEESAKQRRMTRLHHAESVERFRLDSLRSISPSHKMQMFIEGNLDRQERIQRMYMQDELDRLLKTPFGG